MPRDKRPKASAAPSPDDRGSPPPLSPVPSPPSPLQDVALDEDLEGLSEDQARWARYGQRVRPITDEAKAAFLRSLQRVPNVADAARASGWSIRSWFRVRERDPAFAKAWADAVRAGVQVIEAIAAKRAFEGVDEPVYQQGVLVGYKRVFSDRMAELLLRAHDPARFSEKVMVAGNVSATLKVEHSLSPALEEMFKRVVGERGSGQAIAAPTVEATAELVSSTPADLVNAAMVGRAKSKALTQDVAVVGRNDDLEPSDTDDSQSDQ